MVVERRERARREGAASASGEIDLTHYLSPKRLVRLSETQKAELRGITRKFEQQMHFVHLNWAAASGAQQTKVLEQRRKRARLKATFVWEYMPTIANLIPTPRDFVEGLPHHHREEEYQGELWDVVRAIASTKMHYLSKLVTDMNVGTAEPEYHVGWKFQEEFPDLSPEAGGMEPLDEGSAVWERLRCAFGVHTKADYVKHIVNKHDGEARFVGDAGLEPFPASGGDDVHVYKACFWHYQFATTRETRGWLYERSQEEDWCDADLPDRHINWVARRSEEQNQTTLRKWSDTPAPGGWNIRTGNYITLAELFYYGGYVSNCTCLDLYRLYLSLPIFIHKRAHSTSHTAEATRRRNAKTLHYQECGRWGLPKR